jgi:hypothetical protein
MRSLRFSEPAQENLQQDVETCLHRLSEIEQVSSGLQRTRIILEEIYRSSDAFRQQRGAPWRSSNELSSREVDMTSDLIEAFSQEDFNDFLNNSFYNY